MSRETRQVQRTETRVTIKCDRCGCAASRQGMPRYICKACGKDVCFKCATADHRDGGDYPDHFCHECWEAGATYRIEIDQEEERSCSRVQELENAWYAECLKREDGDTTE